MPEQSDVIEVVYYRYGVVYKRLFYTIAGALGFIESGEDYGSISSVGVFKNGEPIIEGGYVDQDPPTPAQAKSMRESYSEATE